MKKSNKIRLYVSDIVEDAAIAYPAYYTVSLYLAKNENFIDALMALHSFEFKNYNRPKSFDEIFNSLQAGYFVIYKEKYIIGLFGAKLMYLESNGWKSLVPTQEVFNLDNYLVC